MIIDLENRFDFSSQDNRALRYRKISVGLPLFIAALAFAYKLTLWLPFQNTELLIANLTISSALAVSGLFLLIWYLQTGLRDLPLIRKITKESPNKAESNARHLQGSVADELLNEINELKKKNQKNLKPLSSELVKTVLEEAEPEFILKLQNRINEDDEKNRISDDINQSRLRAMDRIEEELKRLIRSGATTLGFGVFIASIGIIALAIFVFPNLVSLSMFSEPLDPSKASASAIVAHYVPRLSLVLSIEILAYFFLRLHKSKLSEAKYYQNELINLELKYISLTAAAHLRRQETLHKVITTLSETERNHILEKGQSTIELKKVELEKNQLIEITKSLVSLAPKSK